MKKFFAIALLFFVANVCVAQVVDDFSDGNFSSNPIWLGNSTDFIVNGSNQLQLSNTVAGTSYLTTPFTSSDLSQADIEWQVYVKQTFAPSGSNFGRVYLMSDQSNLTQPLNGYYLQFGEAGSLDAIELFRQSGSTRISVCRATTGLISASFTVRVKVLRGSAGNWQLFADYTGGSLFGLEASGTDNVHVTSAFTGVECVYTATNATKFFYDNFSIETTPIPDTTPPTLQSIRIVNATSVDLIFSESLDPAVANEVSNFSINQDIGIPSTVALQADTKTVRLNFSSPFKNGIQHFLTVKGIRDVAGNEMIGVSQSFLYFLPVSAKQKDIVINEIFPDPSPVIGLPDQEFIELYNRSNDPFDVADWKLTDGSSTAVLPNQIILPQEYWIITSTSSAAVFSSLGKTLGVSNFPTLNNSGDKIVMVDPSGLIVDSVNYNLKWYNDVDKQQGGWTLELLNPDTLRYDSANWLASFDPTGGTPGKQNSQFEKKFDQTPPMWLTLSVLNSHQLELVINEALDASSIQNPGNLSSRLLGNPASATLSTNKKIVTLTFQDLFINGRVDTLYVSGLVDLSGNTIESQKKSFIYFQRSPVHPKDIIINEFMADPTPMVGLPEVEFIELYNRSENPIDLGNWSLSDGSSFAKFPTEIIRPNEYRIITSSSAQQFASFGQVISLPGFPSLNNSGDRILLFDATGQKIDSLTYDLHWYNDADKQQGGWTLELLNPDTLRYDSANWLASFNPAGGTPGKQNSQFGNKFDQTPPLLMSVTVFSSNQLQLLFNERISLSSAQTFINYTVNSEIGNPASVQAASNHEVTLTFQSNFKNGISYSLTISGVSDMSDNVIQSTQREFTYFEALPTSPKDIIITEIMADPAPVVGLPEAEYIEIFNRSANPIDLLNWTLTDGSTIAKFPSRIIQPNEYYIVHSSTTSQFNSYPNRIALSSFPSLNNSSDSIVLKTAVALTIDSVAYSSDWYKNSDKQDGGWSLELIDPENTCSGESNWTASEDERGGTPGKQNSVFANKPDLTGPLFESVIVPKPNELLVRFNERLEKQISTSSFVLSPEIAVSKAYFHDKALREIELKLQTDLSSRLLYNLRIKNLRDCNGNSIQAEFNSISFALPEAADSLDVLVNEVLFNPRPSGVDFVEIFNNSPKYINLKDWKFASIENGVLESEEIISTSDFILAPFTHLALTEDPAVVMNNYPSSITGNFLACKLPSLPDDEGSVVTLNDERRIMDQFVYAKGFHSPLIKDEEGVSLERISFVQPTQEASNWKSASSVAGFATPGYLNSNARPESAVDENNVLIEPEIFSPDSSPEFAKISYRFEQSNFSANVKVFDQQGRLIKTIANNQTLPYEGFFRWDGDREDGSRARMGYYLVWFEVFDPSGFLKTFRKRVVLAGN